MTPEQELERIRLDIEREKVKQQGENDRQTRRITFWTTIFTAVMGVATPIILHLDHIETTNKVDATKKAVGEVKKEASAAAEKAEVAATSVKTEASKLDEKADAN